MDQTAIPNPDIKWDGNTWFVTLPVEDGNVIEAKWSPSFTYVVRIREAGSGQWSFGFATPIPACAFVDLKPDTSYELQIRARNAAGEGEPTHLKMRTNPAGASSNIIPFPRP